MEGEKRNYKFVNFIIWKWSRKHIKQQKVFKKPYISTTKQILECVKTKTLSYFNVHTTLE